MDVAAWDCGMALVHAVLGPDYAGLLCSCVPLVSTRAATCRRLAPQPRLPLVSECTKCTGHQFYITPRALPILLINLTLINDPAERRRLLWWLRTIQARGRDRGGCIQVMLVGTHADQVVQQGGAVWEVYLEDCGNEWRAFDQETQEIVETQFEAWRRGKETETAAVAEYSSSGKLWRQKVKLDFRRMQQTNKTTGTQRSVRRTLSAAAAQQQCQAVLDLIRDDDTRELRRWQARESQRSRANCSWRISLFRAFVVVLRQATLQGRERGATATHLVAGLQR